MQWSYGVTTVPARRRDLLPRTLASLATAGFDRPRVFVDGDQDAAAWAAEFGLDVTARGPEPVMAFASWILALWELYVRDPLADRYALFQDDLVTAPGLLAYLSRMPFPERGYLNLYTFPVNEELRPPGHTGFYPSNQRGKGAVGLVFDRPGTLALLGSRHIVERPLDAHSRGKSIDGAVVTAMSELGWREFVHYPSLVQHTGISSTMGNGPHPLAPSFPGEQFNWESLLP